MPGTAYQVSAADLRRLPDRRRMPSRGQYDDLLACAQECGPAAYKIKLAVGRASRNLTVGYQQDPPTGRSPGLARPRSPASIRHSANSGAGAWVAPDAPAPPRRGVIRPAKARGEVHHRKQLVDVDVLAGQPAAHHVVGVRHDLYRRRREVGVQVASRQVQRLAGLQRDPVHQQRRQHAGVARDRSAELDGGPPRTTPSSRIACSASAAVHHLGDNAALRRRSAAAAARTPPPARSPARSIGQRPDERPARPATPSCRTAA